MTCATCGLRAVLEAFSQIGSQGGERRREATERTGDYGNNDGKDSDPGIDGDRVDARHRVREKMQSSTNQNCRKRQTQQTTCNAEQQAFQNSMSGDVAGPRSQREPDSILAASADR